MAISIDKDVDQENGPEKPAKSKESDNQFTEAIAEEQSDHLTKIIGIFGPFHAVFYFITALLYCLHCWQMMSNKFYTYSTDYWCTRPSSHANFTQGS